MELYGSIQTISGSMTASVFTGSFKGDGSGLYGISATGVTGLNLSQISTGSVTASVSTNGFNVNSDTSITGTLRVNGTIIAEQVDVTIYSSSVLYQSGSTRFGDSLDDNHNITGSVKISGSISLNGQAIGSGKLDETTFQTYTSSNNSRVLALETSSGSLNSFTSSINTTIKSKLDNDNVISGSIQVALTGTTGYNTFSSSISSSVGILSSSVATTISNLSSSIDSLSSSVATTTSALSSSIATTDLNQSNRLDSIEGKTGSYATTGSNLFKGTQTLSGSIIPAVDNEYDLGSPSYQWRDVYISSGSLYIDGTKVISSTTQELQITTDSGQSIKILESGTDSIILQTADGDIELKSNADGDILLDPTNGKILLKGTVEVLNGNKIQSSVGGTPVVFANDIVVSGSIDITGTIEGINLTDFSSSLNTRLGNLESSGGSLNSFTASAISRLNSLESTTSSLNSYTSSNNTRLNTIESTTGSLNSYTSSTNTKLSSIETTTSSIISVNTTQNSRLDSLETTSGSILSTNTVQSSRLDSIEGKTGSYATTGSNIFQGTQTITGSLYISQDLVIAGSSSIQHITSSQLNIGDNIITVNAQNPSIRFGGLSVIDSGSNPQVSGSMLFDSVNNQWLFVHQNQGTVTSSVLLMGPETYNNLGNEAYITTNRLVKSAGIEHLTNSNISDDGTTVTILSNAVINGTFSATGTTIVSGSSQINHNSTTNYVANEHINHTSVSISAGNGLSGGGDISATRTLSLDTTSTTFTNGVKTKMNTEGVVSGSSQISFNGITDKPTLVSGSSQISFNGITDKPTLVSGSSQITYGSISGIPGGIVSGSGQVDLTNTTNYSSGIKTRLNAEGVLSGSAQVVALLPAGTVSGSSQITYGSISGIPSGIVSGSSQISFGSISGVPSGLVSGSSQITLSSTTGYGSVLNQAVLTTSSPTFAGVTSTAQITAGYSVTTEPFVNAHFYNTSTATSTQYGGLLVSGINQAHVRFQVGSNTWGAVGAKQWQIRVGNGGGSDDMRVYSWTYGGDVMTYNSNGTVSVASTLSSVGLTNTGVYSGSGGTFSHNVGNPAGTTELFVHNGANTPVPFRMTKAGYSGAGGSYGILQLYMNDNTNGNGANLYFCANSSNGTFTEYGGIGMQIKSNTAGSATARLYFYRQERAINGTFDSDGTLYTVGNIYTNGNGTTTGNLVLNSSNYTSYAMQGAGYSANQNLNTSNSVTFAGITSTSSISVSGTGIFTSGASDWQISLRSTDTWAGIEFDDTSSSPDYIWYNGGAQTFAIGGGGSNVSGKKLHVHGGMTIGTSLVSTASPSEGLTVAGVIKGASYFDAQASSGFRIRNSNDSANAGGWTRRGLWEGNANYDPALWAETGYGLYFYSNGSANIRAYFDTSGHFLPGTNNTYDLGSSSLGWRNVYTNDLHLSNMNKPEGNDVDGTKGNWTIQEGAENLYIINNNNGKKFKISLEEIK